MATGHEDYWLRVIPAKVLVSTQQSTWSTWTTKILNVGVSDFVSIYTLLAGYKLIITGGEITCNQPGINRFALYIAGFPKDYLYFDQIYIFSQDSAGLYEINAGEEIKGYISNLDNVQITCLIVLRGYLIKL